jgi:hypothetical protein
MDIAELTGKFLIDDEIATDRLSQFIQQLLPYCKVRKNGKVDVLADNLSGRDRVKLVLAARLVASKLEGSAVNGDLCADEISEYADLPKNQAAARAKECADERFAERSARGSYKARPDKLPAFLKELAKASSTGEGR